MQEAAFIESVEQHTEVAQLLRQYPELPEPEKKSIVAQIVANGVDPKYSGTVKKAVEWVLPIIKAELDKVAGRPGRNVFARAWRAIYKFFRKK